MSEQESEVNKSQKLRTRATVVAFKDDKVLLVMDKGSQRFSLPGGAVKRGEPSIAAAARELYEETGLNCAKIGWVFPYRGKVNNHRVFLATPTGSARLKDGELKRIMWWDGMQRTPMERHVTEILTKMDWLR